MKRSEYIRWVRSMLIERRDALARSLRNELNTEWSATPATDVRDFGDAASDSEFRELVAELANADARDLRQINEAITRLDDGTYGICSSCQRTIPIVRLKALPYATRCVGCQRAFDAGESIAWEDDQQATEEVKLTSDEKIDFHEPERPETYGITMHQPPPIKCDPPAFVDVAASSSGHDLQSA